MRLPPMSTLWPCSNRALPALDAAPARGLERYHFSKEHSEDRISFAGTEQNHSLGYSHAMIPSPPPLGSFGHMITSQLPSPASESTLSLPPWPTVEQNDNGVDSSQLEPGRISQWVQPTQLFDNVGFDTAWNGQESSKHCEYEQSLDHDETIPFTEKFEFESEQLGNDRSGHRPALVPTGSPVQASVALPLASPFESAMLRDSYSELPSHLADDMAPPPRKRSRKAPVAQPAVEEHLAQGGRSDSHGHIQDHADMDDPSNPSQAEKTPAQKRAEGAGSFVHNLCGKRFATRQKVKKHHWGNKMNDLNTTTGCWAKHHKPSSNWDDHPSCKEESKPAPLKSHRATSRVKEAKAPVVPKMIPGHWNGHSQDTTRISAGIVQSPHTPSSYMPASFMQDNHLSYHHHSLAPSSPLDSLLAVVNVAAADVDMAAPVPKGRNDSVFLSNLDSQAMAAELAEQYQSSYGVNSGPQDNRHDPHQLYMSSSAGNGHSFGESAIARPVPTDSFHPSYPGSRGYALPSTSLFTDPAKEDATSQNWHNDAVHNPTWGPLLPPPMLREKRYRS
jgi:hypothetical protein